MKDVSKKCEEFKIRELRKLYQLAAATNYSHDKRVPRAVSDIKREPPRVNTTLFRVQTRELWSKNGKYFDCCCVNERTSHVDTNPSRRQRQIT